MFIRSSTFKQGGLIPARCAAGRIGVDGAPVQSDNLNPALEWGGAPAGTKSFAIFCLDDDVPTCFEKNASGELDVQMHRRRFVHWLQADIPASVSKIAEGELSNEDRRKEGFGTAGVNDYIAGAHELTGAANDVGLGYDGPRPPAFDGRWHFYRFSVAALDVERLSLKEGFSYRELELALKGHVLATAEVVGRYTLNPRVAAEG